MKKLIDKKILLVSSILLGLGILSGIIFFFITTSLDKMIVKNMMNEFVSIKTNVTFNTFINSFKYNIIYIVIITLSSLLVIFSPLVLLINYYKGLTIGFLISSTISTFKLKGILYFVAILFPHHILMSILLILYSSIMFKLSLKLLKVMYMNEPINLNIFIKKVLILFITSLIICIIISLLEIYISPLLLGLIA
ncbi:stage II sporulation protein M [Clostridium sp. CAG:628]|nr:stage II sporulation protein M [Clostridium sp. CAG:628]